MSTLAPLMVGTAMSHNSGIPVFGGNPVYSVQDGGTGNTSSVLVG